MNQTQERSAPGGAAIKMKEVADKQPEAVLVGAGALDFTQLGLRRVLFFGVCIWAFMSLFLWRRYRLTFELSDADQPLTLFSENALYYSFYLDLVRAPSSLQALQALIYDQRSEHPDVINALERFNIYPELVLGLVYRGLRFLLQHNIGLIVRTPFNFYATNIICFQGLGVACVCVLAVLVGNSLLCGICCFGFFMGNFYHRLILRTDALALREHWGLPFLWMNLIAVFIMLQRHVRLRDQGKIFGPLIATVLSAVGLMLSWQFGVFVLTTQKPSVTQVASLFGMCLLGYPVSIVIRRIVAFYILSFLIVFALMFAPKYLAFSFFPHVAVSVFLSLWWCPRQAAKPKSFAGWLLIVDFQRGLVALAVCGLIRCALLSSADDDDQDRQLIERQKMESLVGGGPTPRRHVRSANAKLSPAESLRKSHERARKGSDEHQISALSPGLCYLVLQTVCFTALMLLIARLRVLALPLLCVSASLAVSAGLFRKCIKRVFTAFGLVTPLKRCVTKRTKRVLKFVILIILTALSLIPFYIKTPLNELLTPFPALENANNPSKQRLLEWLSKNVPAGSGIMGDMTTSAVIRAALPSLKIIVHPQYENVGIRKRVQFSYGVAACPPMAFYNKQLKELYKADFVIQNSFRCSVPPNSSTSVFDVADKIDEFRFNCPAGISREQRFCFRSLFDNNGFFELVYANEIFSILEKSSWQPWIDRCKRNDPHCGANIAGIGMRMLERHQLTDVATFLHSLAIEEFSDPETMEQYALYLDFNLRKPEAAEKYYREAVSIQPPSLSRAVQYALYLQENGKGREQFLTAAKKVITAMKTLKRSRGELLKEEDNICRGAVLLQLLANDMSHSMTSEGRKQFSEAAHELWLKSKEVNIQNGCVVQHWQLFEGVNLSIAKRIVHFFVG
ncbi:hypothetical protein Emag_002573 [Eimeria magna]